MKLPIYLNEIIKRENTCNEAGLIKRLMSFEDIVKMAE
jgi:hypothetical protein